jgi:hypothetical protein
MNSNEILGVLDPFNNNKKILVYNQSVPDITKAILSQHDAMRQQYDKIYHYFEGLDTIDTAQNVFNYLKKNVKYVIEPDDKQTVKTPSAIIATGKTGSDCKNFALFSAGILDAYRRNEEKKIELAFRFASYEPFDKTPQHVFVVINPGTDNEIWVDPVLNFFNQKKNPYFYKDKKIKNMALMALSGIFDGLSLPSAPQKISSNDNSLNSILSSFSTDNSPRLSNLSNISTQLQKTGNYLQLAMTAVNSIFPNAFSTSWSENWNALKGLTADQQLTYYIQGVISGKLDKGYLNQYSELFGNKAPSDPKFGVNHFKELHYEVAKAYNDLYQLVFPTDPSINQNLIDLTQTIQPSGLTSLSSSNSSAKTAGISTIAIVGLIGAAIFMFTKKR